MPSAKPVRARSSAKAGKPDFDSVFLALRAVLEPFVGPHIAVQTDKPGNYHLEVPSILHRKKPLYFAGVRTGKNYVSFHLLCAYFNPGLVKSISPSLKKRTGDES